MRVETARRAFAKFTGPLDDATLIATEGQATTNLMGVRQMCKRLIALLEPTLAQLQRFRRRFG